MVWANIDGLCLWERSSIYAPFYGSSILELHPVGVVSPFLAGVSCSYLPPGGLRSSRLFRLPDNLGYVRGSLGT